MIHNKIVQKQNQIFKLYIRYLYLDKIDKYLLNKHCHYINIAKNIRMFLECIFKVAIFCPF